MRAGSPSVQSMSIGARAGSPSASVVHVLLQPSGSEKFWFNVVLASWPKMLHSSLLHKMIDRDGVPPTLRHKVWLEILAGGKRRRPTTISTGQQLQQQQQHSSMTTDIRRMQCEPGRRMSDALPPSGLSGSPPSSVLSSSLPGEGSAGLTSSSSAHASALQPVERCGFCSGYSAADTGCTCPLNASLLLPLTRPSAASLQMVLEGFVQAQGQASPDGGGGGEQDAEDGAPGYVQGMSYLAEVLLCSMPPLLAVDCLRGMFAQPFFRSYLAMRVEDIAARFTHFEQTLALNAPALAAHFRSCALPADCYYLEFLATLCAKQLPTEWVARVWDGFMLHGEMFILRATVALLQLMQPLLLGLGVSNLVRALREPMTLDVFVLPTATATHSSATTPSAAGREDSDATRHVPAPTLIAPRALFARTLSPPPPPPPPGASAPEPAESPTSPRDETDDEVALVTNNGEVVVAREREREDAPTASIPISSVANAGAGPGQGPGTGKKKQATSSFWWWPFSSSKSVASSPPPFSSSHAAPMPHLAITLQDLLVGIQQVEVPQHVEEFCRQAQWKQAHTHGQHGHH
jgi:hypothetical protein